MPIAPMLGIRDDSVTNTVVPVGENTPDLVAGVRRDKKGTPIMITRGFRGFCRCSIVTVSVEWPVYERGWGSCERSIGFRD